MMEVGIRCMKEIELTRGLKAKVDDEDFEQLNRFRWHATPGGKGFYAKSILRPKDEEVFPCMMHWAVLKIKPPKGYVIDHIDGDGLNNQRSNLRVLSTRQNTQNKHGEYSSKYPGVSWSKVSQKWLVHIMVEGKIRHLGLFDSEEEAQRRYALMSNLTGNKPITERG
jgi:hypothetical protein